MQPRGGATSTRGRSSGRPRRGDLLRALYATWQARAPHLDEAVVSRLLDKLSDPPTYNVPRHAVAHSRHYLPDGTHMRGMPKSGTTTANSDDAVDKALDTFVTMPTDVPLVVEWKCDLTTEESTALRELAALLPYLGRAESVCTAVVGDDEERQVTSGSLCGPIDASDSDLADPPLRLLVPNRPLDIASLTLTTTTMQAQLRHYPHGAHWVDYRQPKPSQPVRTPRKLAHQTITAVRWAISTPALPSRHAALAMCDVLRMAALSHYDPDGLERRSPLLAGKDFGRTAIARPPPRSLSRVRTRRRGRAAPRHARHLGAGARWWGRSRRNGPCQPGRAYVHQVAGKTRLSIRLPPVQPRIGGIWWCRRYRA